MSIENKVKVFIAHSSKDNYFVEALYEKLKSTKKIEPWVDFIDFPQGNISEIIDTIMPQYDHFIFICSRNTKDNLSFKDEYAAFFTLKNSTHRDLKIYPILLNASQIDVPVTIRMQKPFKFNGLKDVNGKPFAILLKALGAGDSSDKNVYNKDTAAKKTTSLIKSPYFWGLILIISLSIIMVKIYSDNDNSGGVKPITPDNHDSVSPPPEKENSPDGGGSNDTNLPRIIIPPHSFIYKNNGVPADTQKVKRPIIHLKKK